MPVAFALTDTLAGLLGAIRICALSRPRIRTPARHFCNVKLSEASLGVRPRMRFNATSQTSNLKVSILTHRCRHSSSLLLTVLTPPAVFAGLLVTLWAYKCMMMIVFQDKIIYMPSVPPFSRSEKIADYEKACAPVVWREERIRSMDGTKISLCVGSLSSGGETRHAENPVNQVVVLYFQGNGSSLPPRLPTLTAVMKAACANERPIALTVVALSYRGYWNSSGRASQRGIEKDAAAALDWVHELRQGMTNSTLVLWGQSIGAGVASQAIANALKSNMSETTANIDGLILETPFTSVQSMLISLYPQKWLPYRYLSPFLWNFWDSEQALKDVRQCGKNLRLLIVNAEKDEVVPTEHGPRLVELVDRLGFKQESVLVRGALHHEAMLKREGRNAVVSFLRNFGS